MLRYFHEHRGGDHELLAGYRDDGGYRGYPCHRHDGLHVVAVSQRLARQGAGTDCQPPCAKLQSEQSEGGDRMTFMTGQTFTSQNSGVTGTITEIVVCKNGAIRLHLEAEGVDKWTTVHN